MNVEFDCHLPNLLAEVLNNQSCWVLATPINITRGLLAELAELALEIDDDRLHIMMLRLGLYECSTSDRVKQIKRLNRRVNESKNTKKGQTND